jgi:hypothetical protein
MPQCVGLVLGWRVQLTSLVERFSPEFPSLILTAIRWRINIASKYILTPRRIELSFITPILGVCFFTGASIGSLLRHHAGNETSLFKFSTKNWRRTEFWACSHELLKQNPSFFLNFVYFNKVPSLSPISLYCHVSTGDPA